MRNSLSYMGPRSALFDPPSCRVIFRGGRDRDKLRWRPRPLSSRHSALFEPETGQQVGRLRPYVDVFYLREHGFHKNAEKSDHQAIRRDKLYFLAAGSHTRPELGLEALFAPRMTNPPKNSLGWIAPSVETQGTRPWLNNLGQQRRS